MALCHARPRWHRLQESDCLCRNGENRALVYSHVTGPKYLGTATFKTIGGKTAPTMSMLFESVAECDKVKPFIGQGIEHNFDRLEAHLAKTTSKEAPLFTFPSEHETVITRVHCAACGV